MAQRALQAALRPFHEWAADVPCQKHPDWFFPEPGAHETVRAAKTICRTCPSQTDCLNWAVTHHEKAGIWGGLTPNERINLRRRK